MVKRAGVLLIFVSLFLLAGVYAERIYSSVEVEIHTGDDLVIPGDSSSSEDSLERGVPYFTIVAILAIALIILYFLHSYKQKDLSKKSKKKGNVKKK